MKDNVTLLVESSPQLHEQDSTAQIMWTVVICLLPAGIWGVFSFGPRVISVLVVAIGTALITEYVMALLLKQKGTLLDGSAFVTGLLIAYVLPPAVPLYIPAVASVFAIGVVKWSFGGLGNNWMNPALGARAFVTFSWTGALTTWTLPRQLAAIDATSSATPLGISKGNIADYAGRVGSPMELLMELGYPQTAMDHTVTQWINSTLGVQLDGGYIDLFIGNTPGSIGEISALFLLLGAVYLLTKKIITWEIPGAYIGTFGLLVWIFSGSFHGAGLFNGDVFFHVLSGGLMLGAFYMATDMVTSPLTRKGMLIFGIGAGLLTYLIRFYGSMPEGVALSIIIMNIFVPLINRYTQPKRFGLTKGGNK